MGKLTPEILADIKSSILILVGDNGPTSLSSLTSDFQASGYETKRAWVNRAAKELADLGKVRVQRGIVSMVEA